MYEIIQDFNHDIFAEKEGPFVSIYQNTHKSATDVQQDMIAFKNHLRTVEESLRKKYDEKLINTLLEPLRKLKDNKTFWHSNKSAVAIFAMVNDYVIFRLNKEVNEKVIVADSFHTKPLIRHFQTRGTFDVLALDREMFALYTCTQDVCHKVDFEQDTPISKEDVLGTLDDESYLSHASYNGATSHAMYHGHDDSKDVIEKDTERYFRYIDRFINNTYSKPTKRPLVLWTLPEHHGIFHKLSKNKYLLKDGVKLSDKDLNETKVLEKAWEIIEPIYKNEIKSIVERYQQAHAKGLASDNIHEIGKQAIQANIETAIIASDKTIPGKLNNADGTVIQGSLKDPLYDDVLDDLAEHIFNQGGSVFVLDEDDMPTEKGIAAIFRY
ncbi:hypothetical protein [Liberiplasma polymorphum]|uniref:baeRF3 domain-containing protein n=1 Tax=Liberiplasma polymorphum TaxID=3374570 RepID=UPI003772BDD5